ncbi:uncharacterized protein LOC104868289 isoform X2 [Fukomys damarensis]|uniref:uncharacterized protein LOC104868289 isoform X2 n=1 Tax=Fukomys damarensis TaxID=885580 RepID=UPI00053FD1E5|nr:uncharacterized protein LOC104868289 isoform X2 [Fukomys damarensis]
MRRQGMLPTLVSNSWTQAILLLQPPEQLGVHHSNQFLIKTKLIHREPEDPKPHVSDSNGPERGAAQTEPPGTATSQARERGQRLRRLRHLPRELSQLEEPTLDSTERSSSPTPTPVLLPPGGVEISLATGDVQVRESAGIRETGPQGRVRTPGEQTEFPGTARFPGSSASRCGHRPHPAGLSEPLKAMSASWGGQERKSDPHRT